MRVTVPLKNLRRSKEGATNSFVAQSPHNRSSEVDDSIEWPCNSTVGNFALPACRAAIAGPPIRASCYCGLFALFAILGQPQLLNGIVDCLHGGMLMATEIVGGVPQFLLG